MKEIRLSFSTAFTAGKRSGSRKIVFEHYDSLVSLWGGCAGITLLSFGVDVNNFDESKQANESHLHETNSTFEDENYDDQETEDKDELLSAEEALDEEPTSSVAAKSKSESQVPKLIDNKRKHLEKNLSASQRDQLLLNEAKEDSKFHKDLAEAMRQSTTSFSSALDGINQSMMQIGNGLCRSLNNLTQAMREPQSPHQNFHYQQTSVHSSTFRNGVSYVP